MAAGLGHLYAGHPRRASLVAFVSLATGIFGAFVSAYGFAGLALALALSIGFAFWAAIDAARAMRTADASAKPRARWWAYAIFFGLFLAGHQAVKNAYRTVAFEVPVDSMSPALIPGDHVMVDRLAYSNAYPQVGDIIVFRPPDRDTGLSIKRVAASTGDTVEAVGPVLLINDVPVIGAEYVSAATFTADEYADFPEEIVPDDHVFVVGDNPGRSRDSRDFGFVPISSIVGRVVYVYASIPEEGGPPDLDRVGLAVR